jgi:hypothetical protein
LQWKSNVEEILFVFIFSLISLFYIASQAFTCFYLSSSNKLIEIQKIESFFSMQNFVSEKLLKILNFNRQKLHILSFWMSVRTPQLVTISKFYDHNKYGRVCCPTLYIARMSVSYAKSCLPLLSHVIDGHSLVFHFSFRIVEKAIQIWWTINSLLAFLASVFLR